VSQSVDLSAYAGQQILLRFNVIKQPGQFDLGMVIDNIAIEAIGMPSLPFPVGHLTAGACSITACSSALP